MSGARRSVPLVAVAALLGFLGVVQFRSQSADAALAGLSSQDLTVLVANLTTRNEQLRAEVAALESQRRALADAVDRGDSSSGQVRADLGRILAWSGALPVSGPGVRVAVDGPLDAGIVVRLLNELRNAGAEAIAANGIRVVAASAVGGPPGGASIDDRPLGRSVVLLAIGQPEVLTGSLTRAGGPIALLAARYPEVVVTVTPADNLDVPATRRALEPVIGRPSL